MNSDRRFSLTIDATGEMRQLASITLYDAFDEVVGKSYGSLETSVATGLYRISMEINENIVEKQIRVANDHSEKIPVPKTYSSFLMEDFESSHEYYSYPAMEWSRKATTTDYHQIQRNNENKGLPSSGALFLFFRSIDLDYWNRSDKKSLRENFVLLDNKREVLTSFTLEDVVENLHHGWIAYNAPLAKGTYYLQYKGGENREIPIYVYAGWQTQLFLTFRENPVFSTLRISIERPYNGFRHEDHDYYILEAAMQKLQNGIYFIPEEHLTELAYGKWENPMMGIIAAYMYLASDRKDRDELFTTVVRNLEQSILGDSESPEITTLKAVHQLHLGNAPDEVSLKEPCMLMAGLRMMVAACSRYPFLIAKNSFVEKVTCTLYADTPFTSYRIPESKGADAGGLRSDEGSTREGGRGWLSTSMVEILQTKGGRELGITELATRLVVTPNVAAKTIKGLLKEGTEDLDALDLKMKLSKFEDTEL